MKDILNYNTWKAMDGKIFHSAEECGAYEECLIEKAYIGNFSQARESCSDKRWYYVLTHNDMKSIVKVMRYQHPDITDVNLHDLETYYPQWLRVEKIQTDQECYLKVLSLNCEINDLQTHLGFLMALKDEVKVYR